MFPRLLLPLLVAGALAACSSGEPVGQVEVPPSDSSLADPSLADPSLAGSSLPDTGPPAPGQSGQARDGVVVHRPFDELPAIHPSVDDYGLAEVVLTNADGSVRWELPVLLADERPEQIHGLMEVEHLPDGTGMLFPFEQDRENGFWMFGTRIPLDIVYFRADGSPVTVRTMEPCSENCPSYPPSGPYRHALEVPAGFYERIGFDLTWRISFALLG